MHSCRLKHSTALSRMVYESILDPPGKLSACLMREAIILSFSLSWTEGSSHSIAVQQQPIFFHSFSPSICHAVSLLALCTGQLASCNKLELTYISSFNFAPSTDHPVLYKEFWYNSLCDMWESSHLSVLEIPLRTNIKGKIGRFPQ